MNGQDSRRWKKALAVSFVMTFAAGAGCAVDVEDSEPNQPTEEVEARGRLGKADLPGTCEVSDCGGKSQGQCYCDAICTQYGDCCSNVSNICDIGDNECAQDADCGDGFCGWDGGGDRVCKPWGKVGDSCGGFVMQSFVNKCHPDLECVHPEPTHDVPGTCQVPASNCDPTLICGQAISCIGGQWYPTTCGPANCDQPMGDCGPTVNPPPPPAPTCESACGGPADNKVCYCDAVCESYGDCCDDYANFCG